MKTGNIILGAALSLLISSCGSPEDQSTVIDKPNATQQSLRVGYESKDLSLVPFDYNLKKDLYQAKHQQMQSKMVGYGLFVFAKTKSEREKEGISEEFAWREQDAKVRTFLKAHEQDEYAFFYRQECAKNMLVFTDILRDDSNEALNSLAYYTEILLDEEFFSPGLMYFSLEKLKAVWGEEKTSNAVKVALNKQEEFLTKNQAMVSEYKGKTDEVAQMLLANAEEARRQNDLYVQKLREI